ncbi:unannotated protein [freshwater metagenome]|uniref:Unannotated protein n=1 Tax=freshwater metagenome TaxID=449393 RepID=A0A6J6F1Z2_9ZZZZ
MSHLKAQARAKFDGEHISFGQANAPRRCYSNFTPELRLRITPKHAYGSARATPFLWKPAIGLPREYVHSPLVLMSEDLSEMLKQHNRDRQLLS